MPYIPRADCQIPGLAEIYAYYLPVVAGSFVEVGAADGVSFSNTVFLAEAGWSGLYVEPHPVSYAKCVENCKKFPRVGVANVAISNAAGEADLYDIGDCSTLVWDKSAVDWGGDQAKKFKVKVLTLDELLDGLGWHENFDLLVIDVENNETKVLAGFDIRRWKPGMVIIEAHELDPAPERNSKSAPINQWFHERGYQKIYADHINSIFVTGGHFPSGT